MRAAAVESLVQVEQVNSAAWMAVTAAFFVAWTALLLHLSRRGLQRMHRRREAIEAAIAFGGFGSPGSGGHQPVAPLIVDRPVIVGRITADARRRTLAMIERQASAGDPRLRLGQLLKQGRPEA